MVQISLRQERDWGPNDAVWESVTFRVDFRVTMTVTTHLGVILPLVIKDLQEQNRRKNATSFLPLQRRKYLHMVPEQTSS